ncbi:chondroitin sulfate synthase 2-like [Scleropages formosus]|uniref:Hexosyltransferase n=1 Tax=Scleropages formosus TaxID=113540 RepID=A0A0P7V6Y7_SCLFO|nr:chondroitin sulfate synthase 2-like [Scleropages formosus]
MHCLTLLSLLRPVGPVIVGISLGFTLSLLSVTWVEDPCDPEGLGHAGLVTGGGGLELGDGDARALDGNAKGARRPSSISSMDTEEDFEPRIVPYKPGTQPQSQAKKVFRAKYISTELGIRERLFVGVLTSRSTVDTLGVAMNRTIGHHLDTVVFFTGMRNRKVPHGMFVVAHGDDRLIWNMFQTIKYVLEHYAGEYDWFYFIQDDAYLEADRIKALVGHLSVSLELYMGRPEEFWLGRCVVDSTGVNCVDRHEVGGVGRGRALRGKLDLRYLHFELGQNSDPSKEESEHFENAISVHPVSDPEQMYRLHRHFTEIELQRTYKEIEKLQAEIRNVSEEAVDGNRSTHWPVGVNPPFEPKTRFEVLRWDYFTEELIYTCLDESPKCELRGIDKMDINDVIETAMGELNKKYKPVLYLKKQQLINGYRRFDPTRGMEYTLDLQVEVVNQKGRSRSITKRVHLVRPLSRIEIIPMPYVTEATRVHVILPMTVHDREYVGQFLDVYATQFFETSENAVLTFLFIYDPFEAQQVNQHDIFSEVKGKITSCERKYPTVKIPWISVKTEAPSQIKILDIISKKHPVDTLFFIAHVNTNVNSEFLNRCRMNSINNWQVFFPIHFQDYNPEVAYHNQEPPVSPTLSKDAGYFDRNVFDEACFYNSDYMAARSRMAADVQENEDLLETLDVYDMFVKYSGLHVFRAVEPALHQKYRHQTCDPRLSEDIYHRCIQSNLERLGSRSQLAVLLFDQEQGNST